MSLSISWLMLDTMVGSVFNAANKTKRGFYTMVFMTIIMVLSVLVAVYIGNSIIAVAWAFLFAKVVTTIINYFSLMKALESKITLFLMHIIKPLSIGSIMFCIMWYTESLFYIDNIILVFQYKIT